MKVREMMKIPYKVDRDLSLDDAAVKISNEGSDCILFMNGDKLRGIVTERDILKNYGKKEKISEIMSKNVITIDAEAELKDALELMRENRIKRLPVEHEGKILGVISITDLISEMGEVEGEFF